MPFIFYMAFLNPYFLFGLFAVAVPVIIHLFNFRKYKKVYFTNVRFLKEVKQETKKKSQLRHLIILALRILAIIALVFAFAQPYIPLSKNAVNPKAVNYISIYIDNSFSMQAEGGRGTLLEEAKVKAAEIAAAYRGADHFQLLTNDFEARHRQFVNREELTAQLREVELSPVSRSLPDVIRRQSESFSEGAGSSHMAYLISDFQKTTSFLPQLEPDTANTYYLIPVKSNKSDNLSIDSCWFESPVHLSGQTVKLYVSVRNNSDVMAEKVPLKLSINNIQKAVTSLNIAPNSSAGTIITYLDKEPGIHHGTIEITDSPVTFDDKFYFSYDIKTSVPVVCINGTQSNIFLNSLLAGDSAFMFQNVSVNQVDYNSLASCNLIIMNEISEVSSGLTEELQKFVGNGGHLFVIPPAKMNLENYKKFLSSMGANYYTALNKVPQKIADINLNNPVYADVFESVPQNIDLPKVTSYYSVSRISQSAQDFLMKLQNGEPFLSIQECGNGKVFLLSVPLNTEFSNFPKHALFVPTLYKIAMMSRMQPRLYYVIGRDNIVEVPVAVKGEKDMVLKLRNTAGNDEIVPQLQNYYGRISLLLNDQVKDNGNYLLTNSDPITGIAFNYDKAESDMKCFTQDEINSFIDKNNLKNTTLLEGKAKSLSTVVAELNQGKKLWKTFVLLALLFLASEVVLLRLWK
ncbi:MAG TPA: BatA domain-containing protein [Bacteroidales bacterium]|nr:BatA domain-containing protein [Bacteroidales bacterium]